MKRSISVTRSYKLSDFNILTLVDTIEDIPEKLVDNDEYLSTLRQLQFLRMEIEYRKYYLLASDVGRVTDKPEAIAILLEKQAELTDKLNNYTNEKED